MTNKEAIASLKTLCNTCTMFPKCVNNKPECFQAIEMAISALKKQEQTNAQSVNSMRTSRPNALESLNILEQAKDDKGNVPMSLVRQAFRNVLEQDRWHSVAKEGNPKESGLYIVIDNSKMDGNKPHTRYFNAYGEKAFWSGWRADEVIAWKPLPEAYTEEE